MKKAFTLVELIVVIGIICVLAGTLIVSMSGGTDSARAARCLSNMKNLASACQTYGMAHGHYPLAGNRVYLELDESQGIRNVKKKFTEIPGWISTMTKGYFPGTSYRQGTPVSLYCSNEDEALYALTNGALWSYVSANKNTYVCPEHAKHAGKGSKVRWSYVMSAYFGWDSAGRVTASGSGYIEYGTLTDADKRLLFSEVPYMGFNSWKPEGDAGSKDTDAILQYSSSGATSGAAGKDSGAGGSEELGVNHRKGRESFAHVAFADGHVEKLRVKTVNKVPDTSQMGQLATWLATGADVSFSGSKYEKVD